MVKRRFISKLIWIALMVMIIINTILPSFSQANNSDATQNIELKDLLRIDALDGVLRYVAWPFKLLLLIPGLVGQAIMSLIISGYHAKGSQGWITVDNILFNQLALTDINIFSEYVYLISADGGIIDSKVPNSLLSMRQTIAQWYYGLRNLAIVLSLLMLVFLGIKIALTNIASKKAEYKNMLINWFTGFGLIFILHYIIIIAININNFVIQILARANLDPNNSKYENLMNQLLWQGFWVDVTISWTSSILYVLLVIITFILLIMFIKRLLTISILVVFSPLICITYSIDKSGDNKSQIVNTWLKEFLYNVFIQIAYAVSYLVFGKLSIDLACTGIVGKYELDLGVTFLAILSLLSMFLGVKIIKQIFGFDKASNLVEQMAMGAVISKTVSTTVKGVKNIKGYVDNKVKGKQEEQMQEELKNVPKYSPTGQTREEVASQIRKQKADEVFRKKAEQAEERRSEKATEKGGQNERRPLRNAPKVISAPIRMYKTVLTKAFKIDKIEDGVREITNKIKDKRDGNEIVVTETDVLQCMFHGYVNKVEEDSKTNMTKEQFEQKVESVRNADFSDLSKEDGTLKRFLDDLDRKQGKNQAQTIISHFKDERWGANGTNI